MNYGSLSWEANKMYLKITIVLLVFVLSVFSVFLALFQFQKVLKEKPEWNVPKMRIPLMIVCWVMSTALMPLSVIDWITITLKKDVKK